ncbi:MAG TPA: undecaprenyl-phosphate glucose phosphotransferase [Caldilineae bacterium]|nr:undecaprenyl-phosphate glucose phosphotransferase [Caldilineae bacterium]
MRRQYSTNYLLLLICADVLLTLAALFLASKARYHIPWGVRLTPPFVRVPVPIYVVVAFLWPMLLGLVGLYDARRTWRVVGELQAIVTGIGLASLVLAGILYLSYRDVPRRLFLYFATFDLILLTVFHLSLRVLMRRLGGHRYTPRVLIVGAGKVGREVARRLPETSWSGCHLIGYADDDPDKQGKEWEGARVLGTIRDVPALVREHQVDEVIFALPLRAHQFIEKLVLELQTLPVQVRVVPDLMDLAFFRATIDDLNGIPLIGLRDPAISGFNRLIKRALDLAVAGIMLILCSPLMLIIAIAIRIDSPGPAIFKQQRVGENGRLFWMYKFRSMYVDAEQRLHEVIQRDKEGHILYKRPDDPRVTRVGRFLRRTSLDELPQLFNVIKGEMSVVGPRPELPWLVAQYEAWQHKRFAVPPGITGWWQVNGRSDRAMHLHTEDDLYYIQHYSPLLDLRILWKTIGVVLRGRGAY